MFARCGLREHGTRLGVSGLAAAGCADCGEQAGAEKDQAAGFGGEGDLAADFTTGIAAVVQVGVGIAAVEASNEGGLGGGR